MVEDGFDDAPFLFDGVLAGEPFTLAGARDQVIRVIDEAAGGRAVLAGLSLGGYVAMEVAAQAPERVRALILSGATAEPTGPRVWPYRGLAWVLGRFDGPRLDALNARFFRARFPSAIPEPIVRFLADRIDGGTVPADEPMLAVLIKRHYREYQLRDLHEVSVDGRPFASADYTTDRRPTHLVSTVGRFD